MCVNALEHAKEVIYRCVERGWKSRDVILPSINIAINIACMLGKVSSAWVAVFNLPLRALNTLGHYHIGHLAVESFAFAYQFDPIRRVGAIITDILSAGVSYSFGPDDKPWIGEEDKDLSTRYISLHSRIVAVAYRLITNRLHSTASTISSGGIKLVSKWNFLVDIAITTEAATRKVVEVAGERYSKAIVEEAAKEVAETAGHEVAKRIPIFSIAISTMLAFYRFSQGQFWRGVGELASGAASCIPGYGTAASIGLDIVLISMDIGEVIVRPPLRDAKKHPIINAMPLDLPGAYWILGIDPKTNPRQEQVEESYRQFHDYVHSDKLKKELIEQLEPIRFTDGTQQSQYFLENEKREHRRLLQDCKDVMVKVREVLDLENRRVRVNTRERIRMFFRWGCFHWKTV